MSKLKRGNQETLASGGKTLDARHAEVQTETWRSEAPTEDGRRQQETLRAEEYQKKFIQAEELYREQRELVAAANLRLERLEECLEKAQRAVECQKDENRALASQEDAWQQRVTSLQKQLLRAEARADSPARVVAPRKRGDMVSILREVRGLEKAISCTKP